MPPEPDLIGMLLAKFCDFRTQAFAISRSIARTRRGFGIGLSIGKIVPHHFDAALGKCVC